MIQDMFHDSTVQVRVLMLPAIAQQLDAEVGLKPETPTSAEKTLAFEISSALQTAQQNYKALNIIYQWLTKRNPPSTRELHGCPRVAWQLSNQLKSLEIKEGILCRRFDLSRTGDHFFQQILSQDLIHELLSTFHSYLTGRHLFSRRFQNYSKSTPALLLTHL